MESLFSAVGGAPSPRSRGFTLVEALVVAVIMGLLAAVSIPMYSGYIKNQKRQAAVALAQTAAVTAAGIYRRTGNLPSKSQLNAAITLANPSQFDVDTLTISGQNYVRVIEKSTSDTAWGLAKY